MSSVPYINEYNLALRFYQSSPFQKLLVSPYHFAISQILTYALRKLNRPQKTIVTTFWQEKMEVWIPETVSVALQRYHLYEPSLTFCLLKFLKPQDIFVDIGSHFGYFSLLASSLVGELGEVHCFEPTPSTFSVLKRNTLNKSNIKANNVAVWSSEGMFEFSDFGLQFSAFNSFFGPRLSGQKQHEVTAKSCQVSAVSLDKYLNEFGVKPNFIKIDAESAEYHILLGMQQNLVNNRPIISMEVGDQDLGNEPLSRERVLFLSNHGYGVFELAAHHLVAHNIQEKYLPCNLLFIPEEKVSFFHKSVL